MTFKKGDTVFYTNGTATYRARVQTAHKNGDLTVKALFEIDKFGKDKYGYLGFVYKALPAKHFRKEF